MVEGCYCDSSILQTDTHYRTTLLLGGLDGGGSALDVMVLRRQGRLIAAAFDSITLGMASFFFFTVTNSS